MLVVDASSLYEVVTGTMLADEVGRRMADDDDLAAPHVIDVEVLSVIRRHRLAGLLDPTAADQAVEDLGDWPGQRFGHQGLLERAWELRHNVRGWDAVYVALAEALDATLLTSDLRLGRVEGLRCAIDVVAGRTDR
jgi:predicted nucleic acid-binding protein